MTPVELAERLLRSLRQNQPRAHGWEIVLVLRKLGDPGVGGHAAYVNHDPAAHPPRMAQVEMLMTALAALCDEDPSLREAVRLCMRHVPSLGGAGHFCDVPFCTDRAPHAHAAPQVLD